MATSSVTTVQPLELAKETILGMTRSLETRFGCQPRNDLGTTLSTKFGVQANKLPTNPCLVKYFSWGVGGRSNDNTNLSSAEFVSGLNMSLYKPRPFRAVPLEQDLSATERAKYAMRKVQLIGGIQYALYYLKLIDFTQSQVQYIRTDPGTGAQTGYNIDYANLNPVAPVRDSNGVVTDIADQISVVLPGTITLTGQEVLESAAVMDGGDMRYAIASEIGFVSASTESVSATDFKGVPFSYNEAILAQLVDQYNWVGQPFMSTSDSWSRNLAFSIKNLLTSS